VGPYVRKGTCTFCNLNWACVKLISVCVLFVFCLCSVCVLFVISLYRNNDKIEHNSSAVGRIYGREKAP